uniref:EKC/KEOPS complex subunit TPRKB n=1 Tax=Ciona intestinalis TaxID=7719 RepID=H2XN89_CIOIN|nr:EKC/KEOPS complex subunit TPRKB [Ciona intestinalis]|eukprot:XP_004226611.1 EKC/KEOPS complex subunit TPRKB [Ciona intestinalis]
METYDLSPVAKNKTVSVAFYRNVKNAKELKELAMRDTVQASFVKASMIADVLQIKAAAAKGFHLQAVGKIKTKTLHSEMIFNLSPSNKISDCFQLFGLKDTSTDVVAVTLDVAENEKVLNCVVGDLVSVSLLQDLCDKPAIKKLYKITDEELKVCSFLDCILSQMAAKDIR